MEKEKKSLKALFVQKRHKRDLLMQQQIEARQQEQQRIADTQALVAPKPQSEAPRESDPVWSAKTQDIRNRLTDKKRQSAERWNRFSGTSDAGARGL